MELAPSKYHVCQFSVKWTTLNFSAKILESCQIMCDTLVLITLRVLQRAGWRWMELGVQLSNTLLKFCCKAIISWRFIICFRILWFHLNLMISSKDISSSQRLKCSLDNFFMLGILQGNSSTLKRVWEPFLPFNSCLILAQSLAPFPCLFSYW